MGPARAVQGLWGGFMVTPNTVGGHFSHPVWQAAVHEAQGSEAQNKTESQDSLRPGRKNMQVPGKGFLKEAVKLAGMKSCPVLLSRRA